MKYLTIILALYFLPKYQGDFRYYEDKYGDYWELKDSTTYYGDTLYHYTFGGQKFTFNKEGEKCENTPH